MKKIVALALLLTSLLCTAAPMLSVGFMSASVTCNNVDQLVVFNSGTFIPPSTPGAGPWPAGNFSIRYVCISHYVNGVTANAYAVVGHSGPNGDWISPMIQGSTQQCIVYPYETPVQFTVGEYLDVHTSCQTGSNHWVAMSVGYTVP